MIPPLQQELSPDELVSSVRFDADGLVAAIAQDRESKRVLMLAWMNRDALVETLATRRVCYWSRSRRRLWRKGETSGHTQELIAIALDCDGDTLLLEVVQHGPACHTGAPTCFYRRVRPGPGETAQVKAQF